MKALSCLSVFLILLAPPVGAVTLAELIARNELTAKILVETTEPLLQRAPLTLSVEVATQRWFSRGTQVRDFRIKDAVVRPYSSFADNQTLRENGSSWTVQTWRFRVYPQNPGVLTLPPLSVFISVNTDEHGDVAGELILQADPLAIVAPPGADGVADWPAGRSLRVSESWSDSLDTFLPGDAITRNRRFEIEAAPAMMLPNTDVADIPGLSVYRAPAEVRDQSNRGRLNGVREEQIVITFEKPGIYRIPGLELRWFNTVQQRFEEISLDGREFTVIVATEAVENRTLSDLPLSISRPLLIATLTIALCVTVLWLTRRSRLSLVVQKVLQRTLYTQLLSLRYRKALRQRNSVGALEILRQSLPLSDKRPSCLQAALESYPAEQQTLRQLLAHAYGGSPGPPAKSAALRIFKCVTGRVTEIGAVRTPLPTLNPKPTHTQT